jgi:hypothetical protein
MNAEKYSHCDTCKQMQKLEKDVWFYLENIYAWKFEQFRRTSDYNLDRRVFEVHHGGLRRDQGILHALLYDVVDKKHTG